MDQTSEEQNYTTKLIVAYDGSRYSGWQIQISGPSIQQCLEEQLAIILRQKTSVVGAGRTDAGVHAMGQVAHFHHSEPVDHYRLIASLNGMLPRDIRIKSAEEASSDFNARHSAKRKIYHYHLNIGNVQDPFLRHFSWHIREKIDLKRMQACIPHLIGVHNFTSFANEPGVGGVAKNPVRTLDRVEIVPQREGVRIEFEAKSFLYKMVRNMTGTLVEVGRGKRSPEDIPLILKAKDRRSAGVAAPPQGLFLMQVDYS